MRSMALTFLAVFAYLRFRAPLWPDAFHFGSGLMAVAMTTGFCFRASSTIFAAVRAKHGESEADAHYADAGGVALTVAQL